MVFSLFKDPSLKFLAYFNEIDKKLDEILLQDKFIPYNEKLKFIAHGEYAISHFVTKHIILLKQLGEIRNEISHGIKIDGENLISPTKHAIKQIKKMRQAILYPYTAEYFVSDMFESCTFDTKLSDVATMLKRQKFVPIKSINLSYIGVCSYETIARYFIYKSQHGPEITVQDIPIQSFFEKNSGVSFQYVARTTTLFDIYSMFYDPHIKREILCISDTGKKGEQIRGIISSYDLATIAQLCFG